MLSFWAGSAIADGAAVDLGDARDEGGGAEEHDFGRAGEVFSGSGRSRKRGSCLRRMWRVTPARQRRAGERGG